MNPEFRVELICSAFSGLVLWPAKHTGGETKDNDGIGWTFVHTCLYILEYGGRLFEWALLLLQEKHSTNTLDSFNYPFKKRKKKKNY